MDDETIVSLFFEIEKLDQRYMAVRKNTKLHGGQYHCILCLFYHGDMKQSRLAEMLDVRSTSLSELLGKLEAKGLVKREPSPQDKRTFQVSLTPAGIELAQKYDITRAKSHHIMVSRLSPEEKAQFYSLLTKIKQGYLEEEGNRNG
ncbi:MAG: MarR family transcriptional regulator [Blautia sp.]|jgi:DNA-binding MarR family transcriptional regulator